MSTIGGIEIQMLADLARLRQDMDSAKGLVGKATADMGKMASTLKTALGAVGVALTAGAFAGWIKGAINSADQASKLAKAAGVATKDVAGLQLAFRLGGPGADAMAGAMSKLSKQVADGAAVFETLGIKTRNNDGTLRSSKAVLYDTADAFRAMGSGTLATSKAVELFGKSGADMVPMLLEGSAGLKKMADDAEALGLVIDDKTGAAAEEFNDTLDLMGAASQGVATKVMAQLLPTLNGLAGSMLDTVKNSDLVSKAADGIGVAFKLLYSGVAAVVGGFSAFGTYLGAVAAAAVQISQGEFKQAYATLNAGFSDAGGIVKRTAKTIEDAWTGSAAGTATAAAKVNKGLQGNTQSTKDYEDATKAAAKAAADAAAAELKGLQDIAKARSEVRQKEYEGIAKWEADEADRRNKEVKAAGDAVRSAQDEYDNQGKLRSQIAEVTLTRLLDKQAAFTAGSENFQSTQKEIEAQRDLIAILKRGEVRDAAAQAAKDAATEWQKTTDDIGRGLTDSLFRAFEAGKGFFSTLWDGIKNTIKTTVLKVALEPVQKGMGTAMASIMGGLSSGFTGNAAAAGGGGGGGAGGMLGSLGSMAGGLAGDVVGSMMGAGTAGGSLLSSGMSAGLAAAGPYVAVALALYAAYKLLAKKKTPHLGSVVGVGADGKASTMYGDGSRILDNFHKETDDALRGMGGATVGSLNSLSKAFGGAGGFAGEFKFAADGADASIGSALFSRNGAALAGGVGSTSQFAFYSKDREEAFTAYTADVARATRAALDGVALPKWAREQFAKLGNGATIEEFAALSDAIAATQEAMRVLQTEVSPLGGVFARVAGLSGDALKQLTDFAGGIGAFSQKVGSYVKNYYSEDEQAALSAASLQRSLAGTGVDLSSLTARNSFRALVDTTDVGTEAGRKQMAALLDASETFAGLSAYLEKSGLTFGQLAALAPSIGGLGDLNAGAAQVDGLALVGSAVTSSGADIVGSIQALQASVEAGLAAVATSTGATARQLERWDDGGALLVSNGDDGTGGGGA